MRQRHNQSDGMMRIMRWRGRGAEKNDAVAIRLHQCGNHNYKQEEEE